VVRAVAAMIAVGMALNAAVPASGVVQDPGTTTLGSLSSSREPGNSESWGPALSADGRYLVFASFASNLVPRDTNDEDVFIRDLQTGTTERVSVADNGDQGNSLSSGASVSRDGRYVVFQSAASNLVPGDTNVDSDVFLRDRSAGTTEIVSVDSTGTHANGPSFDASISADGRYVVFESSASNLVDADNNGSVDVFVRDLSTGTTSLVSVDGREVQSAGFSGDASVSAHGRYVAFWSAGRLVRADTNRVRDVFVRDRLTGTTERVSVNSQEAEAGRVSARPVMSSTGRYVAFVSAAANLVPGDTNRVADVFVRDREAGTTRRASVSSREGQTGTWSDSPAISANGRYVAFQSLAPNLVAGDANGMADVFLRDRGMGTTTLLSVNSREALGNAGSADPAISDNGRLVAFYSEATNLTPSDTTRSADVFVRDRAGR